MLIRQEKDYVKIRGLAKKLVGFDLTYPEYVFRRKYKFYYFMENGVAKFFSLLCAVAAAHCDEQIIMFALEPEGTVFWHPNCGHYGAVVVDVKSGEAEWDNNLLFSPVGRIISMYSSPKWTLIFGGRQKWSIFIDNGFDLAVLGSDESLDAINEHYFVNYVHDANWAIEYWKTQSSRMDENFYQEMLRNYGTVA